VRAFLIDPAERQVTEIDFEGGSKALQKILGCCNFAEGSRPLRGNLSVGWDGVFVSDDPLETKKERHWFQVDANRYPPSSYPIAGRGLVVGVDTEGDECDAGIDIEELRSRVTFTQRKFRGFAKRSTPDGFSVRIVAPIVDGGSEK
jgi:hypothetical protein